MSDLERVQEYFITVVWPYWLAVKFHQKKPGPKNLAQKKFAARAQSIQAAEMIFAALKTHVEYLQSCENKNREVDRLPYLSTWLHQRRDEDVLSDDVPVIKKTAQRICACGSVDNVSPFAGRFICKTCYLKQTDLNLLREEYRTQNLARKQDESLSDYLQRLKTVCKQKAANIKIGVIRQ